MRYLDERQIKDIAIGSGVLGTGGGGNPYLGMLAAIQAIRKHGDLELYELDELPDDTLAVSPFAIGSPVPYIERVSLNDELMTAFTAMSRYFGREIGAIVSAEIGGVKNGGNPHVWFSAAVRKAVAQAITRAYEGTRPDGKADFDKLNQQWRSKEDEVARKITETKRKADGEAYAATESVAEYLAGDLGLKDATPTGYMRATANESEPTPTDIKQFTDMLEAGKVGLLVVNIQEETELTGKIVTAAKSSNIPIVELTEQMPEQYDSLTDWMAALVDAFSQAI